MDTPSPLTQGRINWSFLLCRLATSFRGNRLRVKTIWLPDSLCAGNGGEAERGTASRVVVFGRFYPSAFVVLGCVTSGSDHGRYVDVVSVY